MSKRPSRSSSKRFPKTPRGSSSTRTQGAKKGARIVIGIHACREVLRIRPNDILKMSVRDDYEGASEVEELVEIAEQLSVKWSKVHPQTLQKLGQSHQGVAIEVNSKPLASLDDLGQQDSETVIALDGIVDPHNVGAIMRTAWLMGVKAILVPEHRASHYTPTAAKVGCGAMEHLPLIVVGNLGQALGFLKDSGFWIYGLAHNEASQSIWSYNYPEKLVWVIGSEAKGVRPSTEKQCDELVSIPQEDSEASFNASVAAAIALSESKRQNHQN